MVLDRDGTMLYKVNASNIITALTPAEIVTLLDETQAGYVPSPGYGDFKIVAVFPELRHVAGYYIGDVNVTTVVSNQGYPQQVVLTNVEVSTNSTNGIDGTWTTVTKAMNVSITINPGHRTLITHINVVNVKAMRFSLSFNPYVNDYVNLHIYGAPAAGQVLNRLAIWHPSLNQRIGGADLDWGDAPRSSSANRTFRVKNLSAALTAASPLLGFDALTDTVPSVPGQHTLALDGLNFFSQVTLPALAPGAISSVVTVRRVTPADAALSLWDVRMIATASSWV